MSGDCRSRALPGSPRPAFQSQEGSHIHITVNLTKTDGRNPPYDHNFLLGSAVYDLLRRDSKEASTVLHDAPGRSAYVLSEIHGVRGKKGEFWFRVGTSSPGVIDLITKALKPGIIINIGETSFSINELRVDEPEVRPGQFITISPILLRDKETKQSIVCDSKDYHNVLQTAINAQIHNNLKETSTVSVMHVTPKGVRKRTISGRTYLSQKALINLNGSEKHLRFLVNHGIGRSPSLAFGMIVLNLNQPGQIFKEVK